MPKISLSDALAPKEEAPLKPIMKGYRSIRLHGVEFLVSTTEDGFLDLNDAFYIEDGSEEYKVRCPEHVHGNSIVFYYIPFTLLVLI